MMGTRRTTREIVEANGVAWPDRHPDTGEAFTELDAFSRSGGSRAVHHLPPYRPTRRVATAWETVTVYDDEGEFGDEIEVETAWRELTDEEWASALATYEREKHETLSYVAGPVTFEATFRTASGATARGMSDGKSWVWIETEWPEGQRT